MYQKLIRLDRIIVALIATLLLCPSLPAQEEIEMVKQHPPEHLTEDIVKAALSSIDWQLRLHENSLDRFRKNRAEVEVQMSAISKEIDKLTSQLPNETRFVDSATRSQLVGNALQQMLDARLELTTREMELAMLTQKASEAEAKKDDSSKLIDLENKYKLEAAERKLEVTQQEFDRSSKLAQRGMVSDSQVKQAEFTLQMAKLELEKAAATMELLKKKPSEELAQRMIDHRLEMEPLKARINAVHEFMEIFSASGELNSKIDKLKRQRSLWEKDYEVIAKEMIKLGTRSAELKSLRDTVSRRFEELKKPESAKPKSAEKRFKKKQDKGSDQ